MDEVKHWLTSKTIVAAAIAVAINLLSIFHVSLPTSVVPADIADAVVQLSTAVLGVITIFGRLVATKKLAA